jgi:hypothetical protein
LPSSAVIRKFRITEFSCNSLVQKGQGRWSRYCLPIDSVHKGFDSVHKDVDSVHIDNQIWGDERGYLTKTNPLTLSKIGSSGTLRIEAFLSQNI